MSKWKDRLVVLGALAGCVIAAKAMRQLLLWSQISLLPPNIRKFKGEWALVTGGELCCSHTALGYIICTQATCITFLVAYSCAQIPK